MVAGQRLSRQDRIFDIVVVVCLCLAALATIYPLYFVLCASLTDPDIVNRGDILLYPKKITLDGYRYIVRTSGIWVGYLNTIIYTVFGSLFSAGLTMAIAYPLSRVDFVLNKPVTVFLLITMFFSGGLIPGWLVVKWLGLLDTRLGMIILGGTRMFYIIIARTFIRKSIPHELREAALMDGCSDFRYFGRIVIPLSKPLIVVLLLFHGVQEWNGYFKALLYLDTESLFPLQLYLRDILTSVEGPTELQEIVGRAEMLDQMERLGSLLRYVVIIISSAPLIIAYPYIQKYFIKGATVGSIKG